MATVRIVERDRRDRLGEGLLWSDREAAVFWTDILDKRVNRLSLADDRVESWTMPETIGWIIERREVPGFVAGLGRRIVTLTLDPMTIDILADPEPDRSGNRMNDAKADPMGRLWAGTMPIAGDRHTGALYRIDSGRATRVDDGYRIANGPAISPDGRTLFHTDTGIGTVFRFAINDDGTLGPRGIFIRFEKDWGWPDGMTLDAEGGLWIACWGASRVARFDPDGRLDRTIALPASQITNVAFAGAALDRMFVTSASDGVEGSEPHGGALFEVEPDCRGLPTQRFAG